MTHSIIIGTDKTEIIQISEVHSKYGEESYQRDYIKNDKSSYLRLRTIAMMIMIRKREDTTAIKTIPFVVFVNQSPTLILSKKNKK